MQFGFNQTIPAVIQTLIYIPVWAGPEIQQRTRAKICTNGNISRPQWTRWVILSMKGRGTVFAWEVLKKAQYEDI